MNKKYLNYLLYEICFKFVANLNIVIYEKIFTFYHIIGYYYRSMCF